MSSAAAAAAAGGVDEAVDEGLVGLPSGLGLSSSSSDAARQIQRHQLQLLLTTNKDQLQQALQKVLLQRQQQQQQSLQSVGLPPAQLHALQQLPTSSSTARAGAAATASPAEPAVSIQLLQALQAKFSRQQQQQQAACNIGSNVRSSSSHGPLDFTSQLDAGPSRFASNGAGRCSANAAASAGPDQTAGEAVQPLTINALQSSSLAGLAAGQCSVPISLGAACSSVQLPLPPLGPQHLAMLDAPLPATAAAPSSDTWGRAPALVAVRQQQQEQQHVQMQQHMQTHLPALQQQSTQLLPMQQHMLQHCPQQHGDGGFALPRSIQLEEMQQQLAYNSSACNTPAITQGSALLCGQQHMAAALDSPHQETAAAHSPGSTAASMHQQQQQKQAQLQPGMVPNLQPPPQQQQSSPACGLDGNCSSSICSTSGYGTASKALPVPSPECTGQQQPADSIDNIMAALLDCNEDW
jgi:hypothetical protein